jgi:hypothetical protein
LADLSSLLVVVSQNWGVLFGDEGIGHRCDYERHRWTRHLKDSKAGEVALATYELSPEAKARKVAAAWRISEYAALVRQREARVERVRCEARRREEVTREFRVCGRDV